MNIKNALTISVTLVAVLTLSVVGWACDFFFNYEEITALIGTVGEIGVQAQKTHNNCTMTDPLDYQFAWENLQILGETPWEEISPQLYEKWFKVSLSAPGEGFLKIFKTCSKEGYEEAILPVTITEGTTDGIFLQALSGTYPFELEADLFVKTVVGAILLEGNLLTVGDVQALLPTIPSKLEDYLGEARLYYTPGGEGINPLLLVSEDFLYRFDHLVVADSS
ncbi:hypothetical protein KAX17_00145 [Candidatus Bipolaricaulota bacterium]|nr:hypothetical protein [Candidatus Bipolaricaulota bacterium]